MFPLGTQEILMIAIVLLVLFGAKQIKTFMRSLGEGIREFQEATRGKKRLEKDE